MERKRVFFKVDGKVVMMHPDGLYPNEIDEFKWMCAQECEVPYDKVIVEIEEDSDKVELSDIDVSVNGIYVYTDCNFNFLVGVDCTLTDGSDEYLDAMNNNELEKYLKFV